MGSFSVSCAASGLSIYSEKAKLVILTENPYEKGCFKENRLYVVSNSGSAALFNPMFLPISGTYDTYGTLEDIERDRNVEAIEKYFDIDIEELPYKILEGSLQTKEGKDVYGTYILGEMYDEFKKPCLKDWNPITREALYDDMTKAQETLGQEDCRYYSMESLNLFRMFDWRFAEEGPPYDFLNMTKEDQQFYAKGFYELINVMKNMFFMNRLWLPVMSGAQYPELKTQHQFYRKALEIIERDIKDIGDDED